MKFLGSSSFDIPCLLLSGLCLLLLPSCQRTEPLHPDSRPPDPVDDLRALPVDEHSVRLVWTAPRDEEDGRVSWYELRYGLHRDFPWSQGVAAPILPNPSPPGDQESQLVIDLTEAQTYFFQLRSADRSKNWSPASNIAEVEPSDQTPPSSITDLAVRRYTHELATLAWTAPGDDGTEGVVTSYDVRYSPEPIPETSWDTAPRAPGPAEIQPAGTRQTLDVYSLDPSTEYFFSIVAVDNGGNRSPPSNAAHITTLPRPATWYVRQDGTGDFTTVQDAIDHAGHGDEVLVGPGTYHEAIDLLGKRIHLLGEQGPESTVLDASGLNSSVVLCVSGETPETIIEGFTITGGTGSRRWANIVGGGVLFSQSAPTIRGNIIRGNTAIDPTYGRITFGGGVSGTSGEFTVTIEDNIIEDNLSSFNGGGLSLHGHGLVLTGNLIAHNKTSIGDGGGAYLIDQRQLMVSDNIFFQNTATDHGGGLYVGHPESVPPIDIMITENVFSGNMAKNGDGADDCSGGAMWIIRGATVVRNTIVFNSALTGPRGKIAGGICMEMALAGSLIQQNIIFGNASPEVMSWSAGKTNGELQLVRNILTGSGSGNLINLAPRIRWVETDNLDTDPLLCDPTPNSDGGVATGSPALSQPFGIIGADAAASCPGP